MLTTGSRLGPYEIVSPIGAGGMGEVFKARDTRLERSVAIKILPAELARDTQFKIRFEREARAISALNHPHICTLYDIGHENGTDFLVMELIEGESLAERLARGALPLDQVLRYGAQIAEGLDRAHKSGVVHRDLKPGNIMITKAAAKLLDFGLAKTSAATRLSRVETAAETAAAPLTDQGTILGTFQYMAPEQLEGEEADARTDIFALGCVLYEMSTGKRAFEGKSKTSLIAAIVSSQPTPISQIQPLTPAAFEHVVQRCLEKDADDRWQSAHDIAEELKWISAAGSQARAAAVAPRRRRQWSWWAAAIVLVMAAAGVGAWYGSRAATDPIIGQRFELQPPDGVGVGETGAQGVMAISPDGEWVAFRGVSDQPGKAGIYLRSTRDLNARRAASGNTPFFSPDSKWLGFHSDGALYKVPVKGGEPERVCAIERMRGASWGDDGTILLSAGEGLLRVSADGGQPETITSPPAGERHYWPHYLPGSKAALFVVHRGSGDSFRTVSALSLGDRKTRPLVRGTAPQFAGGQLVYGFLGNLHTARFDLDRLELVDKPRAVLSDVYVYLGSGFTGFGVARSGSLVYMPGTPRATEAEIVWIDRKGNATAAMPDKEPYTRVVASPDGSRIVAKLVTSLEESDLWIYELKRGAWTRLTQGKRADMPVWSPDGQWILFSSAVSGQYDIWRVRADGAAAAEKLVASIYWEYPCSVTPDGRTLMFMRQVAAAQWDLLTLPLDGSGPEKAFLASDKLEAFASFSPDGRWVAYESDETDNREVHIRPFPGPGPRIPVSAGYGQMVSWSPSGRELFYRRGKEILVSVSPTRSDFDAPRPQLLTKGETLSGEWNGGLSSSPDGQRLLAIRLAAEAQRQRRLVYIPHWISEVEQVQEREQ